ncbi:MAG: phosphoribosylaminoimidazolesuccinocarboxamide synthase [Nitrososphaeraceae archaeon]|nr:phosphoribosylaminoimidazolesuccinocarboxamide synthase [Nitrososphaeraceae archaeon]
MNLIHRGKVKDVYQYDNDKLAFVFSDRISAFDIIMNQAIPHKGEILCKFGRFWFENLKMQNHMIKLLDTNTMLVKKLEMIPIECIVRGYFYGSLVERYNDPIQTKSYYAKSLLKGNDNLLVASKLKSPIFDPTTKSLDHDTEISKDKIISSGILSENAFNFIKETSLSLYDQISKIVEKVGFIISDVKFEFGFDNDGTIILADSIGPDEFRLWMKNSYQEGKIQDSFDKQLLRDWLIQTGFKKEVDKLAGFRKKPDPPIIPKDLIDSISQRYILAYEKITGEEY